MGFGVGLRPDRVQGERAYLLTRLWRNDQQIIYDLIVKSSHINLV